MMSFWARDAFKGGDGVWGGDYVDLATPFGMRDKLAHLLCGMLLFAAVARFFGPVAAWATVGIGGVAVEAWEWARFAATKTFFSDRPSWRDLLANLLGGLIGWALL